MPTLFDNITNNGAALFDLSFNILNRRLFVSLSQMVLSLREALSYLHLTHIPIPSWRKISPKLKSIRLPFRHTACLTRASHCDSDIRLNLKYTLCTYTQILSNNAIYILLNVEVVYCEDNPSLGIPALSTHQSDLRPLTRAWNHAVLVHRTCTWDVGVKLKSIKRALGRSGLPLKLMLGV